MLWGPPVVSGSLVEWLRIAALMYWWFSALHGICWWQQNTEYPLWCTFAVQWELCHFRMSHICGLKLLSLPPPFLFIDNRWSTNYFAGKNVGVDCALLINACIFSESGRYRTFRKENLKLYILFEVFWSRVMLNKSGINHVRWESTL